MLLPRISLIRGITQLAHETSICNLITFHEPGLADSLILGGAEGSTSMRHVHLANLPGLIR